MFLLSVLFSVGASQSQYDYHLTPCTEMQGKPPIFLDRQQWIWTGDWKTPMRGFKLVGLNNGDIQQCPTWTDRRFNVRILAGAIVRYDETKKTAPNDGAYKGNTNFLDRHMMDCNPDRSKPPRVMTAWRVVGDGGDQFHMEYTCALAHGPGETVGENETKFHTPGWWKQDDSYGWISTESNQGSTGLEYLDRHNVDCGPKRALSALHAASNQQGQFRWDYKCISVSWVDPDSLVVNLDGYWKRLVGGSDKISYSVQVAVTHGNKDIHTESNSKTYTVSHSVEVGFSAFGFSSKATTGMSFASAHIIAQATEQSYSTTTARTIEAECADTPGKMEFLFQFVTDSTLANGEKGPTDNTNYFMCSHSFLGPQCPYTECADDECSECIALPDDAAGRIVTGPFADASVGMPVNVHALAACVAGAALMLAVFVRRMVVAKRATGYEEISEEEPEMAAVVVA